MNREIRALALPAIISNITTPLLGLVDTAIVGHIGAAVYIGAIAVGGSMFNMLYWLFNFLRMGSSGLTAQAYGAGDSHKADVELHRAMFVAGIVSIAMIALASPLADIVLRFMDADGPTSELARTYFMIGIWGAPAAIGTYALAGWLVGMQDSRKPMWMALVTNVVNIAVSLVLVLGLGMKIEGVATGTITAQWIGFGFGMAVVLFKKRPGRVGFREMIDWSGLARFFRVNIDIFLRTVCLVAVTLWFTHAGATHGVDILAANAILLQLFMLFSFFIDGYAYAGEALAGKYLGSGDRTMVRLVSRRLLIIGAWLATGCSLLYLLGSEWFIAILTDQPEVRLTAFDYRWWVVLVPLAGFSAFVFDGVFVGLTLTRQMLLSMAVAMAVFFGLYFLLEPRVGNHALWLAFVSYLAVRGIVQAVIFRRLYPKTVSSKNQ